MASEDPAAMARGAPPEAVRDGQLVTRCVGCRQVACKPRGGSRWNPQFVIWHTLCMFRRADAFQKIASRGRAGGKRREPGGFPGVRGLVRHDEAGTIPCVSLDSRHGRENECMTMIDDEATDGSSMEQLRPARMRIQTTVLMSHGNESHPTELVDISATGVLLRRPLGWSGEPGQSWVLDMIFGHDLHIHLEAQVARVSARHIGFAYTRIPEDKQVPLWNLLGGYADILEQWQDE